jgi:3-(3-hydroxy-phenyl)propionate hydroxylase
MIMPRSRARAVLVHGSMAALRRISAFRRLFDDLGIKPQNAYAEGLFARGRGAVRRGAWIPQGLVRSPARSVELSDEALGVGLALVGLGADPSAALHDETKRLWAMAGGTTVEVCPRGQGLQRSAAYEDLDNHLLPGAAPSGWCVVVRPDRTVLHDGPIAEADRLVRESLRLLGSPSRRR